MAAQRCLQPQLLFSSAAFVGVIGNNAVNLQLGQAAHNVLVVHCPHVEADPLAVNLADNLFVDVVERGVQVLHAVGRRIGTAGCRTRGWASFTPPW